MNISDIKIDGFGVWSGLKLEDLTDGLNVFYGPNEAGKSTLLEFVRSMLFGFAQGRRRYLPPVRGGRPGGSLEIAAPQGCFVIDRHEGGSDPVTGDLRILGPDGTLQRDQLLAVLLCGIDEPIFNNVFAFGLREIQELGSLNDTAAGSLLYKLTTGLDRVSLADTMRELAASRNRILSDDGERPSQIVQLWNDRERLRAEIDQLRGLSRRHAELSAERERLDGEIKQAEAEQAELDRTARLLDIAVSVRDKWHQRAEFEAQLATLAGAPTLPAGTLEEFDRLNERVARGRQRLKEIKSQRNRVRREAAALELNHLVWRQSPRIEALVEQRPWAASVAAEVKKAEAETTRLEAELTAEREQLGLKSGDDITKVRLSSATLAGLRPVAQAVRDAREHLHSGGEQNSRARTSVAALEKEIRTALSGRQDKELQPALERAGNLVSQLRRRVQIDERLEQMSHHHEELTEQSHVQLERQLLPLWAVAALGGFFVLGVVLILAGLFLGGSFLGTAGWTLAGLGLASVGAWAGAKFVLERSAANQLESCTKQLEMLDAQTAQAKEERTALDAQLPRGGGPLLTRLQAAEKDLAALEELLSLDAKRKLAAQEAEAVTTQSERATSEYDAAKRRWRQALKNAGLPRDLSPRQLKTYAQRRQKIEQLCRSRDRLGEDLKQRRRDLDGFYGRIGSLAAEVKLATDERDPSKQLQRLEEALHEHQTRFDKHTQLQEQAELLGRRSQKVVRSVRRTRRHMLSLFDRAGATDEADFRRRAVQSARADWLRSERDKLSAEIKSALGVIGSEDGLREHFNRVQPGQLEKYGQDLAIRRQASRERSQSLAGQRGQLQEQLKTLLDDRRLGGKLLDLGTVEQQLREAIERWQVLSATHRVLSSIRRTYERERQPETLQEASTYLERLTSGQYTRVWTPLDEDVLRVDDADGNSISADVLSRGTREQLFLSLRLALVAAYGRRGARLPLVLDDVLVNFDAKRAKAAAAVLRDFAAEGFQLLVFTCHEHISKMFKTLKVPTRQLPRNTDAGVKLSRRVAAESPAVDAEEPEELTLEPIEANHLTNGHLQAAVEEQLDRHAAASSAATSAAVAEPELIDEPDAEEIEDTNLRRRQRQRKRRDPFASAIWHEPVEEEQPSRKAVNEVEPPVVEEDDGLADLFSFEDDYDGFSDDIEAA